MEQEFNRKVGQVVQAEQVQADDQSITVGGTTIASVVAGRDIVHNHIRSRPLTPDECRALNKLVKQLEDEFGQSEKETWNSIRTIIGIDRVAVMHLEQYSPARTILQLLIEKAQLRKLMLSPNDELLIRRKLVKSENAMKKLDEHNQRLLTEVVHLHRARATHDLRFEKQSQELQAVHARHASAQTAVTEENEELYCKLKWQRVAREQLETRLTEETTKLNRATAIARLSLRVGLVTSLVATAAGAYLWHQAYASGRDLQAVQARITECMYEGKPYSIGSVINNAEAPHIKCVASDSGSSAGWKHLKPHESP